MFKKTLIFLATGFWLLSILVLAYAQQEEQITITTYYPSPFGSYRELETQTLFFRETADGLVSFNYPDTTYDRRLRITAGRADTGHNDQGASIDLQGNAAGGRLDLVAGRGGYTSFWTSPAGTTEAERMRITAAGNLGIGTAGPNTALDLNGALSVRGMSAPAVAPAGQGRIYFDSGSNRFRVSENRGAYADLKGFDTTIYTAGGPNAGSVTLSNDNKWRDFPDLSITFSLSNSATVTAHYEIAMMLPYDGRWISIYARDCKGVPGCSVSGSRVVFASAEWFVTGVNHNSPDYGDEFYVCHMSHLVTRLVVNGTVVSRSITGNTFYWSEDDWWVGKLAAGSHTIKVQYRTPAGGTNDPAGSDWQNRALQVMVLGS